MRRGVEAVFGGLLALIVLAAAVWLVFNGRWPLRPPGSPLTVTPPAPVAATGTDVLCQCYDQAFALAGENVGVLSSQYRTGFESCRAVAGKDGGDAWTAGWNGRISSAPFQATCGAWLRTRS